MILFHLRCVLPSFPVAKPERGGKLWPKSEFDGWPEEIVSRLRFQRVYAGNNINFVNIVGFIIRELGRDTLLVSLSAATGAASTNNIGAN